MTELSGTPDTNRTPSIVRTPANRAAQIARIAAINLQNIASAASAAWVHDIQELADTHDAIIKK